MGGFLSNLFGDPLEQGERAEREGRKEEAVRLYAKGGDHARAAKLAAQIGDAAAAVQYTLLAVFSKIPEGYADAEPRQAGEILANSGHYAEAIPLFELSGAFRQAADAALKLQNPGRAARFYERGKHFGEAALYYQRASQIPEALRALEHESNRLRASLKTKRDATLEEALRKVEMQRAELLSRQGKSAEAVSLIKDGGQATPKAARLLEQAGNIREAIETFLASGDKVEALRLLFAHPHLDRKFRADSFKRAGRPLEAAEIYASLGSLREAAEGFEQGGDLGRAGVAWENLKEPQRAAQSFLQARRLADAARCFLAAGQMDVAARAYLQAGDAKNAGLCFDKAGLPLDSAQAFLQAKDRTQAIRVLKAVPRESPHNERAVLLLVPQLIEIRSFDEALSRIQSLPSAAVSGPNSAEILYWQGRIFEELGSIAEAATRYRKAASANPGLRDSAARATQLEARLRAGSPTSVAPPTVHVTVVMPQGSTEATATSRPAAEPPTQAVPVPGAPKASAASPGGVASAAASGHWTPGFVLNERYKILAELGRGGMGRVYRALDRELSEEVAIKTVLRVGEGGDHEERLLREVQICRKITHPNVVRVFDLGRFPGGIFVTMELVGGQRLDKLIRRDQLLPLDRVRWILGEIAAGLDAAHALHVVHRDLKPSNVMLTDARVKILDFGIARMAGNSKITQTGYAVGSPLYMSPEQLQGLPLDGRSDLYALGVLAYALTAGREPFVGDNLTVIAIHHIQNAPPDLRKLRPEVPDAWVRFIDKLLKKTPEERPPSARAVLEAIQALPI